MSIHITVLSNKMLASSLRPFTAVSRIFGRTSYFCSTHRVFSFSPILLSGDHHGFGTVGAPYDKDLSFIALELKFGAHNYHPMPVVLSKGKGAFVWDVNGNKYFDFLSAYSAVNQGHAHPAILKALTTQAKQLCLVSRAFHSEPLGPTLEYMSKTFGYQKTIFMNSGAEAVETAMKLSRRWAYDRKGVPRYDAKLIFAEGNFHGRTIAIVSASSDPDAKNGYGPFLPGILKVPFNDADALEKVISSDPTIAAFFVEPIQGEAGVIVPSDGYMKRVREICTKYNVLMVCDEVQTGLCRTGSLLAIHHEKVRPDMVILGKALSGGVLPISAVLCDDDIMLTIGHGQHGSTYGGNPLACRVAVASLEVLKDENLATNAHNMGNIFRQNLCKLQNKNPELIKAVRGRGLLNAMEIVPSHGVDAMTLCMHMKALGLLAKPTHLHTIRLAPPLIITENQIMKAVNIIGKAVNNMLDAAKP